MEKKQGDFLLRGVWYDGFSIEKATFGGQYSQKEIKAALKRAGIKYTTTDYLGRRASSMYQGHWAIFIESKYTDEVSEWLWGSLSELPDHTKEKK